MSKRKLHCNTPLLIKQDQLQLYIAIRHTKRAIEEKHCEQDNAATQQYTTNPLKFCIPNN